MRKLASALNCTVSYFLTGEEEGTIELPDELVNAYRNADSHDRGLLDYLISKIVEEFKNYTGSEKRQTCFRLGLLNGKGKTEGARPFGDGVPQYSC